MSDEGKIVPFILCSIACRYSFKLIVKGKQEWISEFQLYECDRACLNETDGWLGDGVINAVQCLLKETHPEIGGLQPPVLGQVLAFEVQRKEFVQVLYLQAEHHWLTVSNIDCPAGNCVYVYDSLFHTASDSCIKQIAAILCHSQREIKVVYPAVQRQRGSSDCGAFALAFATSLCSGENPAAITYCQKKLRSHIVSCLENRCITSFPCYSKRKAPKVHTEVTIDIICLCRLPEYGNMICCHACGEWYHENCVKAPKAAWEEEKFIWVCNTCGCLSH